MDEEFKARLAPDDMVADIEFELVGADAAKI
jgi:hypothetical protein